MTSATNQTRNSSLIAPTAPFWEHAGTVVRGLQRGVALGLVVLALTFWLAPGASWESDIMLFKLALSATAALAGGIIFYASRNPAIPTAEVDVDASEVRMMHVPRFGQPALIERIRFCDLGRAIQRDGQIRLRSSEGETLAELCAQHANVRSSLIPALRNVGKLPALTT
ncbi:hypothetical protein C1J03_14145 [Sulfitobacter sp. SK012]|uniref:hypothetical protein n=1 Tax=Sulfitobacter sp. SK012 TaxID=1389005 RepID=UPI000E0C3A27|nr:hypothetical protein [Sulfitobacter sp. SK012]AXI47058.1 hypothetical protein C1J03_14145 [Sulfitobacter sp. SK012]